MTSTTPGQYTGGMALHPDAEQALGSIRLEGGEISSAVERLGDRVARGELSGDEAVALLAEKHRRQPVR